MFEFTLIPGKITLADLRQISRRHVKITLDQSAVAVSIRGLVC